MPLFHHFDEIRLGHGKEVIIRDCDFTIDDNEFRYLWLIKFFALYFSDVDSDDELHEHKDCVDHLQVAIPYPQYSILDKKL